MLLFVWLLPGAMVLCGFASIAAGQTATRSIRDGVYSAAQADRGTKTFVARCASCHQRDEFTGTFLNGWNGKTLDGLLEMVRTSMPEDNPGSLTPQEYADVLAFILSRNAFPPGAEELPSTAPLKQFVIEEAGAKKP